MANLKYKMMKSKTVFYFLVTILLSISCVSQQDYLDLNKQYENLLKQSAIIKAENEYLKIKYELKDTLKAVMFEGIIIEIIEAKYDSINYLISLELFVTNTTSQIKNIMFEAHDSQIYSINGDKERATSLLIGSDYKNNISLVPKTPVKCMMTFKNFESNSNIIRTFILHIFGLEQKVIHKDLEFNSIEVKKL